MTGVAFGTSGGKGWHWYFVVGGILGSIVGFVIFCACWFYCVATYGFLVGVCLGWIPAAIVSGIVGVIVALFWGPIVVLGALFALYRVGQPKSSERPDYAFTAADASAAAANAADAAAAAATNAAAATTNATAEGNASTPPPPPPDLSAVERGVDALEYAVQTQGFAGAVAFDMKCYAKLNAAPSWDLWDECAAFDEYGARKFGQPAWTGNRAYFDNSPVVARESKALSGLSNDYSANQDRIAAIRGLVSQAIETISLRAAAGQTEVSGTPGTEVGTPDPEIRPSFDCAHVKSDVVKLVCATPSLAQADINMAAAYRAAMAASRSQATLIASQRQWIKQRNNGPADVNTIASEYATRTATLEAAAKAELSAK